MKVDWPDLSAFQEDVILILLSTIFGGGGAAYLTNNHFGRQYSIREDRKRVLDEWLPGIWDIAWLLDPNKTNEPIGPADRPRADSSEMGHLIDFVWRAMLRTTWRDRRQWNKFAKGMQAPDPVDYRMAHRKFERYLLRQFDRRIVRMYRWFEDKDHLRKAKSDETLLYPAAYGVTRPSEEEE